MAEGAAHISCGSLSDVSQLADRLGPQGAAHQHSPIHQPDRASCWKAGPALIGHVCSRLTHEMKTQCYRSATASLWCQSVLLIRDRLPCPLVSSVQTSSPCTVQESWCKYVVASGSCLEDYCGTVLLWDSLETKFFSHLNLKTCRNTAARSEKNEPDQRTKWMKCGFHQTQHLVI